MASDKKELQPSIYRANPPIFPTGFRCGVAQDIMIIDFVDIQDANSSSVFSSIVLTERTAGQLKDQIDYFLNTLKEESKK